MKIDLEKVPSLYLGDFNKQASEHFRAMRKALTSAGPLDAETCELIVLASFATIGSEPSFKVHALRALKSGVSRAKIEHAVLVTLGATTPLVSVANALRWIEEANAQFQED